MGYVFFLMGKSASGKDTLYQRLKEELPDLKTIVGYTTRPIRDGEENGREYFFVDRQKMDQWRKEGRLIESRTYHTVHGEWNYFMVDDGQIQSDGQHYLMIGTLESYRQVRDYYGKERVLPIYIEVEDGVRLQRALNREKVQKCPKYEEMCRRFLADSKDFCEENLKDCGIEKRFYNVELEACLEAICGYVREKIREESRSCVDIKNKREK